MATQSFLKNINLISRGKVTKLVDALERSKEKTDTTDTHVNIQKTLTEIKGEQAKEIAKRIKWSL